MKILWISPTPSHPQNAGNRAHIFAMGKEILAAGHDVTFLLYGQEMTDDAGRTQMESFWPRFIFVPHRLRDRKKTQGDLWGIDDWFNIDLESAVRFLQGQDQFDAVYCEYVFLSKVLTLFPKETLKILSCHDRMSDRAELLAKQGIPPDFYYTSRAQEKIALDRADLVIAIQENEKLFFESLTQKTVIEVGYPVKANFVLPQPFDGNLRVGYLGSNNSLNRKSVELFLSALKEDSYLAQHVESVLAGAICDGIADEGVTKLGVVEDESEFYRQIDIAINPMVDGTGLKIKSLSAIRHGVPLLATETGGMGLPVGIAEHRFKDVADLVMAVRNLLLDPVTQLDRLRSDSKRVFEAYQDRHQAQVTGLLRAIATKSIRHLARKMVLLVTDVPFWEFGVGSHSRILALCRALQEQFALTVFFFGSIYPDRQRAIEAAGFDGQVVSYKAFEKKGKQIHVSIKTPDYPGLKKWRHETFVRSLKAFLSNRPKFDAVVFEYLWLAYTRDALWNGELTVLDLHDLMAYRDYRFSSQGVPVGVSIAFDQELALLDRFDAVIAIQNSEAATLRNVLKSAIALCCPHGVEVNAQYRGIGKVGLRLGFGGTSSAANVEALRWFLVQVWPAVSRLPVTLHVFGNVCEMFVSPVPAGVSLHGLLKNLDDAYALFDVMVNPVIHGGGIKIKSIEALAYGKPLIASPEGAVGIAEPERAGVIVARSRTEFIDAIVRLLKDPDLHPSLSEDARRAARDQFSSQASFAPLIELIGSI